MSTAWVFGLLQQRNGTNNIPSGQFLHLHFMTIFSFANWKQRGSSIENTFLNFLQYYTEKQWSLSLKPLCTKSYQWTTYSPTFSLYAKTIKNSLSLVPKSVTAINVGTSVTRNRAELLTLDTADPVSQEAESWMFYTRSWENYTCFF